MCVFCNIVSANIPSYKVYEDDDFLAFLDISQATYGHTLVIPKKHYDNLFELDNKVASNIMPIVKKIASAIKISTSCEGINILNNNGVAAGQSVNHYHIHIIPRYKDDDLKINFVNHNYAKEDFISLCDSIKSSIK